MNLSLPFPGYSWPFTQHAVGLEPKVLYDVLACAACFEGHESPGANITELMIENDLLTPNYRGDKADAWRDYQQILAELGLIYSTSLIRTLTITRVGKLFLAGEVGFSELMTQQALRYQYPNGQKSTIQARMRAALQAQGVPFPNSLIELMSTHGVLIKPAVLILRVLLEQYRTTRPTRMTVDEVMNCLLPIRRNADWPLAMVNLANFRKSQFKTPGLVPANRRNVQDWFKFLSKSNLFVLVKGKISLSGTVASQAEQIAEKLLALEDESNAWIPLNFDSNERTSWFNHFGKGADISSNLELETITTSLEFEYVYGKESEEINEYTAPADLVLKEYQEPLGPRSKKKIHASNGADLDLVQAVQDLKSGMMKQKIKRQLHDDIVHELATLCSNRGGKVFVDPNSVDLLVSWPDATESIFEVKTVTPKSLPYRLRLALGQVQEYSYRRLQETGAEPDRSVVVDINLPQDGWYSEFLKTYTRTGLVCRISDSEFRFSLVEGSHAHKGLAIAN